MPLTSILFSTSRTLLVTLIVGACLLGGCAPKGPLHVPLSYVPTDAVKVGALSSAVIATPLSVVQVIDARAQPADAIGENVENDQPIAVLADGARVVATVREGFGRALEQAGFVVRPSSEVALEVEIQRLWVEEGNVYKAELRLGVHVTRGGRTTGKLVVVGRDTRWGSSFEEENYRKVISDAIVNAVEGMLQSGEFSAAMTAEPPTVEGAETTDLGSTEPDASDLRITE